MPEKIPECISEGIPRKILEGIPGRIPEGDAEGTQTASHKLEH